MKLPIKWKNFYRWLWALDHTICGGYKVFILLRHENKVLNLQTYITVETLCIGESQRVLHFGLIYFPAEATAMSMAVCHSHLFF